MSVVGAVRQTPLSPGGSPGTRVAARDLCNGGETLRRDGRHGATQVNQRGGPVPDTGRAVGQSSLFGEPAPTSLRRFAAD